MNSGRPHVLIIDDEPSLLELMRELLEGEGLVVSTCYHADPDLCEIRRLAPDLILLDHLRRGHVADWSLLQALKKDRETCAIPVVLCTGAAREVEAFATELEAMDVAVIRKPFDIAEFVAVVQTALQSRQMPRHLPPVHDHSPSHPHSSPSLGMAAPRQPRTELSVWNRPTAIELRKSHGDTIPAQAILASAS